ncbi:MAG: DUF1566 domain-containing protein [Proteobacteria bacterium]|nr:DUF1566 domain-containing protein [Pseudomonadota bacterium]
MKKLLLAMLLVLAIAISSCKETSDEEDSPTVIPAETAGDIDASAPTNPSILINSGADTIDSLIVTLSISADDDIGVSGYFASETDSAPAAIDNGWTDVTTNTYYSDNVSFALSTGDGQKTVYIWFKDAAGNVSASANDSIMLAQGDTSAPTNPSVSINSDASTTNTLSVTLTISADDDIGVSGFYTSETDSAPIVTATGWTDVTSDANYSDDVSFVLSTGDGQKTVYVWFKDAAGNVSASTNASITVVSDDTSAPTNPLVSINSGDSTSDSLSVTLSIAAEDDIGVIGYYTSETDSAPAATASEWADVTSDANYSDDVSFVLSAGNDLKTVYVWFKDAAGNVSASVNDSITLAQGETLAPTNPMASINDGDSTTDSLSVTLSISADDDTGVTGYYASETDSALAANAYGWVNTAENTSYSDDVAFVLSSGNGQKTVYVWFKDAAGNVSASASDSIMLARDVAPWDPAVYINIGGDSTTNSLSVTLSIYATDDTGVTAYYASETDSAPNATSYKWTNTTSATSFSEQVAFVLSTGNGSKTVYVWFKDAAGNISNGTNGSITLVNWVAPKLPDTGQTTCYHSTGTFATCPPADGVWTQDGSYTINPPSFTNNSDQTIMDNNTKLMWQRNDQNVKNWTNAGTYCTGLDLADHTDWRLPTNKELQTIFNYENDNPSLDGTFFPNTYAAVHWSSTTLVGDDIGLHAASEHAWRVRFDTGFAGYYLKIERFPVRCVRGGSGSDIWALDFSNYGDDAVLHESTGLMWQKEDAVATKDWKSAITYCESLSLEDESDWRLPNANELQTIVNYAKHEPAIDEVYFPNTDSKLYWTSTTDTGNTDDAWYVEFKNGYMSHDSKSDSNYVRCVRNK